MVKDTIRHESIIDGEFAEIAGDAYLGNSAVVIGLIGGFCAQIEALTKALLGGRISPDQSTAEASSEVMKMANIFSGRDRSYQVIKGYHGVSLPGKLIADLSPHWKTARDKWNDDPTCVLFDWLACLVMEATRKYPDEDDDWLKAIDLKPSIQYAVKVLLGIEERAAP